MILVDTCKNSILSYFFELRGKSYSEKTASAIRVNQMSGMAPASMRPRTESTNKGKILLRWTQICNLPPFRAQRPSDQWQRYVSWKRDRQSVVSSFMTIGRCTQRIAVQEWYTFFVRQDLLEEGLSMRGVQMAISFQSVLSVIPFRNGSVLNVK